MNKKLGRLIQPGMGAYFIVMVVFCAAALMIHQPVLAVVEAAVTAVLLIVHLVMKAHRRRELEAFIQSI